jgi:D-alanyl-D-alanine carboxypeptidase
VTYPPRFLAVALGLAALACSAVPLEAETLDELVDEGVEQGLPGIILLVDRPGEEDDFLAARGFADRAAELELTPDARFRIASNSKSFVGLALAQLELDGVLQLDAPASDWLGPEVTGEIENAEQATIRQLLNHTSGIYDYIDEDFEAMVAAQPQFMWTIDAALSYAHGKPAAFAPGDDWEYSNTNYLLAGKVIEAATGQPWDEVVSARVLVPLTLDASFVEGLGTPTGPIVHGYSNEDGDYRDMFAINTGYGLPDGGLISTAEDLATYIRAIATRAEPLREASTLATSQLVDTTDGDRYGLGISHFPDLQGFEAWGHGGNIEGYSSEMFYFPEPDITLVLLVNGSDGDFDGIFDSVLERAIELATQ